MTDEASDGWDRLIEEHGLTLTAILEALGRRLAAGDDAWLPDDVIAEAWRIDRQRYSRQRGR